MTYSKTLSTKEGVVKAPSANVYRADLTAGSLKVSESRIVAGLLLEEVSDERWKQAFYQENVLKSKNPNTTQRLVRLLRQRLETMDRTLWIMVRDGSLSLSTQALFACAMKHSRLLSDFIRLCLQERLRSFSKELTKKDFNHFIEDCSGRDESVLSWSPETVRRLSSSVFQILQQAGYLNNTREMLLQRPLFEPELIEYLKHKQENGILKTILLPP